MFVIQIWSGVLLIFENSIQLIFFILIDSEKKLCLGACDRDSVQTLGWILTEFCTQVFGNKTSIEGQLKLLRFNTVCSKRFIIFENQSH